MKKLLLSQVSVCVPTPKEGKTILLFFFSSFYFLQHITQSFRNPQTVLDLSTPLKTEHSSLFQPSVTSRGQVFHHGFLQDGILQLLPPFTKHAEEQNIKIKYKNCALSPSLLAHKQAGDGEMSLRFFEKVPRILAKT